MAGGIGAGDNDAGKQRQLDRVLLVPIDYIRHDPSLQVPNQRTPQSYLLSASLGWWTPLEVVAYQ